MTDVALRQRAPEGAVIAATAAACRGFGALHEVQTAFALHIEGGASTSMSVDGSMPTPVDRATMSLLPQARGHSAPSDIARSNSLSRDGALG